MNDNSSDKTPKTRNADATREAILDAARIAFSEKGIDGVGVREIAEAAGCNAALVNRYFGGKEQLFEAALVGAFSMEDLFDVPRDQFAKVLAQYMVGKRKDARCFDPMFLALRSTTNPTAAALIRSEIQRHLTDKYVNWLEGENREQRAALIVSLFSGFYLCRHVIGNDGMATEADEVLANLLAETIQGYIQP